ncbi:MAG: UDP-N-acetylglucosamine 2-epimerase (hydrolyzing) [Gammaproteobacteria bacterium]|nr:UDP-N-acetylglucosamine 2-epimerase (hydrolyzing) [Gammaproteobacteria bacterium]
MSKLKISVVTGSRADYGLLWPLLQAIDKDSQLKLQIIVTGMHLSPAFGLTYQQIEADGFTINASVEALLSGDTDVAIAKSIGLGIIGFADAYANLDPDMIVVLGDRFEIFAATQAAAVAKIPIAHIAGGDVTEGAYDESFRHCITKLSHLHFATNADAARRIIQLGEESWRVHTVGSPAIDVIKNMKLLTKHELETDLNIKFRDKNILVTFHPPTLDNDAGRQLTALLGALDDTCADCGIIFTLSNADTGGLKLNSMIKEYTSSRANTFVYSSLGQLRYYSLLSRIDAIVGNSSSGLYEAPSFKVATVNIGNRQLGRLRAMSVIDCDPERRAISKAILQAFSLDCTDSTNPYGDGNAISRIMSVLKSNFSRDELIRKRFQDSRK